ncbi:MAG: TonB-dependent receptor [Steroidobacteraceae bacterium]|jgi:iron complex outermembrane receptor protein|nr:TonB-dependent receptor [Steroidobacteraceae bacterium]
MPSRRHTLAAAIAAALGLPGLAVAQSGGAQLDEIVVTAQKREQSFQDVGIAVSVFTGEDATKLGFAQLKDVATQTPNVQIKEVVANSVPNVTIRGVGLNDYAANNNPAAGIYVDDVYLVSPAMLTFGLFDLERIEVLKGPQGTLFGRNTTAGTVNFVSRKPGDALEGYLNLDYGRYERAVLEGAVGGPISDTLSGRIALQTVQQGDGWQTNRLNGDKVGEIDRTSVRGQLLWRPSEAVSVLLNVHGGQDDSDVWLVKIDNPFTAEDDGDTNVYRSGASVPTIMELDAKGATLTVDWSISDALTVTSVTGYEEFTRYHVEDRDASSLEQLDGFFDNEIEQFSQELRLTWERDDLVLIGGVFYGEDSVDTRDRFDSTDLLSLLGLAGFESIGNEYSQETTSAAVFLHTEWSIAPDWKLTAGARYTDDQKDFGNAFTFLIPTGGTDVPLYPPVVDDYDVQDVSGKLGIDYSGFDDTLLYASISRGFKSGGFQGQLSFDPAVLVPFDDETLIAYEAGVKSRLLGNTLQLNASVFFYDYSDLQFYGGLFDSPLGVLFGITNVGDAEVVGLEAELWWRASDRMDIRLGLGLLDTEITKSVVDGVAAGSELPNAPDMTFNGQFRYQWPLMDDLKIEALLAANYQGDLTFDVVRDPPEAREKGYWLADARLGIGAQDDRWNVSIWGRNLADERYRTQVLFSSVGFGETWGAPRTYGVSLSFKL